MANMVVGVVIFMLLLNASLPIVNSLGISGNGLTFQYANNVNISAVQSFANCPGGVSGCSSNLGSFSSLSVVIAFGDFLWAMAKIMLFIPVTIALPYYFLVNDFYAPVSIAALYNLAFWAIFGFWIYTTVSGRYNSDIP
jgi:hypothetical protein